MKVEGQMKLGELSDTERREALARTGYRTLAGWIFWAIVFGAGLLGVILATQAAAAAGLPEERWGGLAFAAGAVAGVAIGLFIARSTTRRWWREDSRRNGWPDPYRYTVEAAPDALVVVGESIETRVGWNVVQAIEPVGRYWIIRYRGHGVWVPKRFFKDAEAEDAFVKLVRERAGAAQA